MTIINDYLLSKINEIKKHKIYSAFASGKLEAYQDIYDKYNSSAVTVNNISLTNRELFIYIAVSISFSPLLKGIDKESKTIILRKVCGEFESMSISNGDVYDIFHAIEELQIKLGLALNKHLDIKSLNIARENILSNSELVEQTIQRLSNDPELIKKVQKVLSEK